VARHIVGGDGRAGQDVASGSAGVVVHISADVIPDCGHELPFIDQTWVLTRQQDLRSYESSSSRLIVDIEAHLAASSSSGRLGLPATSWPLDEDGSGRPEPLGQLGIHDPAPVHDGVLVWARSGGTHLQRG
jgi:hypothetical protein